MWKNLGCIDLSFFRFGFFFPLEFVCVFILKDFFYKRAGEKLRKLNFPLTHFQRVFKLLREGVMWLAL